MFLKPKELDLESLKFQHMGENRKFCANSRILEEVSLQEQTHLGQ